MATPTDGRTPLATLLSAELADVDVHAWARNLDQVNADTVVIDQLQLVPGDVACPFVRATCNVWVVAAYSETQEGQAALDELLSRVLTVLDDNGLRWERADRGTYAGRNPAYQVTVEVAL